MNRRSAPAASTWKRRFDFAAALLGLVLSFPIMGALAIVVRARLGKPILFKQERPGLGGRPFTLYKFRTMTELRDEHDELLPDAQRLRPFGRFLRRSSLDELPELWNVLRGDMSLVGPRPLLMAYLNRYSREQARRHEARPGITGWAQIHGRNELGWEEKFERDVWYIDHWSLWLDFRILARTFVIAIGGRGISSHGHATVAYFQGNPAGSETE